MTVASMFERLLGPRFGSRVGRPDDEPDPLELDQVFLPFSAGLYFWAGALGLAFAVVAALFLEDTPDYQPGLVGIPSLAGLLSGLTISLVWKRVALHPWMMHGVLAAGATLLAVVCYGSGSRFESVAAMFFIWPAMAVGVLFERRAQYLHVALFGVAYSVSLLTLDPVPLPGAKLALMLGSCFAVVRLVDRLVRWLETTAHQEAAARADAESTSRLLEEASRHKSEFLASMSHELRTPLNAVIGFSDVLLTRHFGELNDDQAEYVQDIRESGQHLLELINDVLDLSKVESGKLEIDPQWFGVPSLVASSMNLVKPRAEAKGLRIETDVDSVAEAYGDERRIKQVLVNLLTNAVKFTPDGGTIRITTERTDDGVVVAVHDTGVGIAPEDQAKVFDDFRQVGDADLAREGSGLGLALSQRFLELHGGRIAVESTLGEGSTFQFLLPDRATAPGVVEGQPSAL